VQAWAHWGGAAIGAIAGGHAGKGALIGAGVGALGSYIWSQNLEKQKREMEAATQGTGVGVTQTADNQPAGHPQRHLL
jgi:hypothetical protein